MIYRRYARCCPHRHRLQRLLVVGMALVASEAVSSMWSTSPAFSGSHTSSHSPARVATCGRATLLQRRVDPVTAEAVGSIASSTAGSTATTVVCDGACQTALQVSRLRAFAPTMAELGAINDQVPLIGDTFNFFKNAGPEVQQAFEVINYLVGFVLFGGIIYTQGTRWQAEQGDQEEFQNEKIRLALDPEGEVPDILEEEAKEAKSITSQSRVRTLRKQRRAKKKTG
mmetsp:Transcript_81235/g.161144  ORF Transcript_81235/g.161144 Transcript_81235/m.161144 type:complete len:227 (+) Transcript_81235:36-716(+)